jgi:hypothetical protein
MTINRLSLLGAGFCLYVCTLTTAADATSYGNGWQLFRPVPNYSAQTCVNENFGGALNQCGSTINTMVFDVTRSTSTSLVTATAYGAGGAGAPTCQAIAMDQYSLNTYWGAPATFGSGVNTQSFWLPALPGGLQYSVRLQCSNVQNNRGILSLNWN